MSDSRVIRPFTAPASGVPQIPGSKSYTNRALVCAALAAGRSTLTGVLLADDTEAMLDALARLGARVEVDEARVHIDGLGGPPTADASIDARLSGTTSRFMVPMAAAGSGRVVVDGGGPLRARPFRDQLTALRTLGAAIEELGEPSHLPIAAGGRPVAGGHLQIPGDVSSQFTSGILLAAPTFSGETVVEVTGDVVSRPYLDLTVDVMSSFGVVVGRPDERTFVVPADARYEAADLRIEPDASAASYFLAASAITGGRVRIEGLDRTSTQGDVAFADVLAQMGASVTWGDGFIELVGGRLRGGTYDLRDFSDTAQTLAAVAPFADSAVEIQGIGFIRAKETDRIGAMVTELRRCGVRIDELDDGMRITPDIGRLHGASIETYDDHRMAMSMSLVGLRVPGIEILDAGCVSKTFPDFFETLESMRPRAKSADEVTVIAIDGPAGAGKSTVAKMLASALEIPHLDTGAMYRAVTLAALRGGIDVDDEEALVALAMGLSLEIGDRVVLDGTDVTDEIRTTPVDHAVSAVSAHSRLREFLVARQREWAASLGGGVMEGRDIGTVVFPDAALKAYLTASPEVRAERRAGEGSARSAAEIAEIAADIERRDRLDSSRSDSPLQADPGAIVVDTSDLTLDEVVARLAWLFRSAVEDA